MRSLSLFKLPESQSPFHNSHLKFLLPSSFVSSENDYNPKGSRNQARCQQQKQLFKTRGWRCKGTTAKTGNSAGRS